VSRSACKRLLQPLRHIRRERHRIVSRFEQQAAVGRQDERQCGHRFGGEGVRVQRLRRYDLMQERSAPWNLEDLRRTQLSIAPLVTYVSSLDAEFVARFAARIRQLYPGCPPDRPEHIASHACQKYSGRIGRSAAAKRLDEEAVQLAVVAHVRHDETPYDELLARGLERWDARARVGEEVDRVLSRWRKG